MPDDVIENTWELSSDWNEIDASGAVLYPHYAGMLEGAAARLLEKASGLFRMHLLAEYGAIGWPAVVMNMTFHAPASAEKAARIVSRVERVGYSSFELSHRLWHGDMLCAEVFEKRVWLVHDPRSGASAAHEIPQRLRAQLGAAEA